jgi:hypothetical protein
VIDAETIHRRPFLDLVLLSVGSTIRPFLYEAVEQKKFDVSDYGGIVRKAISSHKFTLRNDPTPGSQTFRQMWKYWKICTSLVRIPFAAKFFIVQHQVAVSGLN